MDTYGFDAVSSAVWCKGNVFTARANVVEGVDDFRVLYGIDSDGNSSTEEPQSYISYNSSIKSDQIAALRFALLVNSGSEVRRADVSQSFVLLDETINSYNDRFVREVFTGTVKIRKPQL